VESSHFHHPDFRVSKKIFATLGYPVRQALEAAWKKGAPKLVRE
jgi:hypothetical protein